MHSRQRCHHHTLRKHLRINFGINFWLDLWLNFRINFGINFRINFWLYFWLDLWFYFWLYFWVNRLIDSDRPSHFFRLASGSYANNQGQIRAIDVLLRLQ